MHPIASTRTPIESEQQTSLLPKTDAKLRNANVRPIIKTDPIGEPAKVKELKNHKRQVIQTRPSDFTKDTKHDEHLPPFGPPYQDQKLIVEEVFNRGQTLENNNAIVVKQEEPVLNAFNEPIVLKTHHTLLPQGQEKVKFTPSQPDYHVPVATKNEKYHHGMKGKPSKLDRNFFSPSKKSEVILEPFIGPVNRPESPKKGKESFTQQPFGQQFVRPSVIPITEPKQEPAQLKEDMLDKQNNRFQKIFDSHRNLKAGSGAVGFQKFKMNGVDVEFDIVGSDKQRKNGKNTKKPKRLIVTKKKRKPGHRKYKKNYGLDIRGENSRKKGNDKQTTLADELTTAGPELPINLKPGEDLPSQKRPERDFHYDRFPPIHEPPPLPPHTTAKPINLNIHFNPDKQVARPPVHQDIALFDVLHGPGFYQEEKSHPTYGPPIYHDVISDLPPKSHPTPVPVYHEVTTTYEPKKIPTPTPHIVHYSEPPPKFHQQTKPTVSTLPPKKTPYYHNDDARKHILPITKTPNLKYPYLHTTNHPEEVSTLPPLNRFVATTTLPPRQYGKFVTPPIILNTIIASENPGNIPHLPPKHQRKTPYGYQLVSTLPDLKHSSDHPQPTVHPVEHLTPSHLSQDDLRSKFENSRYHIRGLPAKRKYVHHVHPNGNALFHVTTARPILRHPSPVHKELKLVKPGPPLYRPTTAYPVKDYRPPSINHNHPYGPTPRPHSLKTKPHVQGLVSALPPLLDYPVTDIPHYGPLQEEVDPGVIKKVVFPTRIKSGTLFEDKDVGPFIINETLDRGDVEEVLQARRTTSLEKKDDLDSSGSSISTSIRRQVMPAPSSETLRRRFHNLERVQLQLRRKQT